MRHFFTEIKDLLRAYIVCYFSRPEISEAGFALREVLFASQICEAPEAVKGVQGAAHFKANFSLPQK